MASVLNMFALLRKSPPAASGEAASPVQDMADRSPGDMIAGCEYELRQLRRDILLTRQPPATPPLLMPREPFVLGAGLRRRAAAG